MPQLSEYALPWSKAQDEQLRRLADANIPMQVIGFRLGRRPEAVARRAYELGVIVTDRRQQI